MGLVAKAVSVVIVIVAIAHCFSCQFQALTTVLAHKIRLMGLADWMGLVAKAVSVVIEKVKWVESVVKTISAVFAIVKCVQLVAKAVKNATKPVKLHISYLFCFNINGKDLGKAKKDLKLKQQNLQRTVQLAALNTKVVMEIEGVTDWLKIVEEIVKDVETLENKIQANKVCCNGWCPNLIQRYKQNKEAAKKISTIDQVAHCAPTPGDFEAFKSRKWAFDQIMEALRDDNCSRIGVWGMGGVGKTILVEEVNKKAKALGFNDTAMAVISQVPDIRRIQDKIAYCLKLKLEVNSDSGRADQICLRINEAKKILIILDDIWEEVKFKDIGIPNGHTGCKILVTTRSVDACKKLSCEKKVQLKVLTEEESLALLKKSACIDVDSLAINDDVMRDVVKECQGLPIAIVCVGKALMPKSPNDWEVALQQLRNSKLVDIEGVDIKGMDKDKDKNAYACLKWSYNYLKPNTKLCFLLCSLFPEDYEVPIEELTRYAIGLKVYDDVNSIEEGRRLVCSLINSLKESSLLLDGDNEEYVKMHDMVRDVALWIASKGDNEFSLRICTRLENIKNTESVVTAISLWANSTKQLPDKLVCPKLNFLSIRESPKYHKVKNDDLSKISDTYFEGMKGLKVLSLQNKFFSSQSFQFLTNLRSLHLQNCNFDDLSSLGKLKSLEILSLHSCRMVELPNELGELTDLKVLKLVGCYLFQRTPPNLIQALSQLEELYVEETSIERGNASLLKLMSHSNLAALSLKVKENPLPKGFVLPKLQRYEIYIGNYFYAEDYQNPKVLGLDVVDASSLNAFKALLGTVELLELRSCKIECFDDTMGGNNTTTFSNLVNLTLKSMPSLTTLWKGPIQQTTFRNLAFLRVMYCSELTNLFSVSLCQNLKMLESLVLERCRELKQIILKEEMLLNCDIQPICFPKLRILKVIDCGKLEHLFSISVARCFLHQLEKLKIKDLPELKQVFGSEREADIELDGDKFELSKLTKLSLHKLPKLSSFCQGNISSTWPSLENLLIMSCPKMSPSFVADLGASVQVVIKTYVITVDSYIERAYNSKPRVLRCVDSDASSMNVYKVFFCNVEELELEQCEVECFNDISGGNNTVTFSNLVKLIMEGMPYLRTMWEGAIQQTTFRNLTVLEVRSCSRLTNLFSLSVVQNLEMLGTLILERCCELKQIISEEEILFTCHDFQCFPKLRNLKVIDCGKLEYLFSISVAGGFIVQLEELIIEDLPQLKQVFDNEREVGLDGNKFELSKLRKLSLQKLPKLSNFFQGNTSSTWPSLENLLMMSCPKISPSFVADLVASVQDVIEKYVISVGSYFPDSYFGNSYIPHSYYGTSYFPISHSNSRVLKLVDADDPPMNAFKVFFCTVEELNLEKCDQMECLNDTTGRNNTVTFSYLVKLLLKDMPSLRKMWEGPIQQTTFRNLTVLEARSCSRLTNLFSPSIVQNLEMLGTLVLERCSELKQIISEEEILFACHDFLCFPKLRNLKVIDCGKLEYLFSISVAGGFIVQLEELIIEDLPQLKQVFDNEREVGLDGNKFELSKLRKLSLQKLPKLSKFFQGNTSSTWPSLENLSMMSCPKISPSFVADLVASVQVRIKKYVISVGSYFPDSYFGNSYIPNSYYGNSYFPMSHSNSRVLKLVDADDPPMNALKVFFCTVEELNLEKCDQMECLNDTTGGNNIVIFSNLVKLILKDMPSLRTMWEGPIQQTTFCNLTVLEARSCSRLTNLFSLFVVQNLEKLETLILENCHELKQIISEEEILFTCHDFQCFLELKVLEVIDCGKMEYLFSISVARGFLMKLQKLIVKYLPQLKQVFCDEGEGEVGLDENKFELSKLTELSLQNLPKLSNFFQGNISSTWPSLKGLSMISCPEMISSFVTYLQDNVWVVKKKLQVLNLSDCGQLCDIVLDLLSQGLLDLEELKIESCGGLEDLFQRERLLPSSRLKILSLKDVLVQKCVWKGPMQLVNLNNLKKFKVCRCNRLRQLFSSATLVQSLQQLESLTIEECDELEHLIAEDEEDQILAEGHFQPLYFPKLRDVDIKECNKIKSLFPITIGKQLRNLKVEGASQLVEVFAHEDEVDVGIRKDSWLPIMHLTLARLPNLVSFCPRNYHFILPNIFELKVLSCPNMSMNFARTPDRTVHVNGEVPQLGEKDEPTNEDIDWNRHSKLDALPLLKEEP